MFSSPTREKMARVQRFLEEHGIDAVILASPANFAGMLNWKR